MVALFYIASQILGEAVGRVRRNIVSSNRVELSKQVKPDAGKHPVMELTSFGRERKTASPLGMPGSRCGPSLPHRQQRNHPGSAKVWGSSASSARGSCPIRGRVTKRR